MHSFHQQKKPRLHCLVLHPQKQSMDTSRLEEFSCPVCWERNAYFDKEAKYQKLFIQLALAISLGGFPVSFQDAVNF